jgi:uncharacterized protein YndB with AHSA1/START domain
MMASVARGTDTRVFRVYIKTTPQKIWDAITKTEWTQKYGYQGGVEYDLKKGGKYRGIASKEMLAMGSAETVVDGEVLEADPPHRLVQTWRFLWGQELIDEGFTRVTWEIVDSGNGLCRLTVTHDLTNAPLHAAQIAGDAPLEQGGGGWAWILSDLKSLLETGKAMWG